MKFNPTIGTDLSGKLGGIVASHNTYGSYFKKLVKPVNKKTAAQQSQRQAVAFVSQSYRQLNPTVQSSFVSTQQVHTSRKGAKVVMTGQAAFMQLNTMRQRLGLPIITSPVTNPDPVTMTPPAVTFTSATQVSITFSADAWNASDGGVIVSGAILTSSGISYKAPVNAVALLPNPGADAVAVTLPFAVPIGGRVRLSFHATAPDGRQTTYVTVDATNPSFPPPPPTTPLLQVLQVTHIPTTSQALWEFDRSITNLDSSGMKINNVAPTAQSAFNKAALLTYDAQPAAQDDWTIDSNGSNMPHLLVPQSGKVS